MPDSHNAVCESRPRRRLALDGVPTRSAGVVRQRNRKPERFSAWIEPFAAWGVVMAQGQASLWAGIDNGPAISVMAIGTGPQTLAGEAGWHHGKSVSPGIARGAVRPIGTGRRESAPCATGTLSSWRLSIQPAKL